MLLGVLNLYCRVGGGGVGVGLVILSVPNQGSVKMADILVHVSS